MYQTLSSVEMVAICYMTLSKPQYLSGHLLCFCSIRARTICRLVRGKPLQGEGPRLGQTSAGPTSVCTSCVTHSRFPLLFRGCQGKAAFKATSTSSPSSGVLLDLWGQSEWEGGGVKTWLGQGVYTRLCRPVSLVGETAPPAV